MHTNYSHGKWKDGVMWRPHWLSPGWAKQPREIESSGFFDIAHFFNYSLWERISPQSSAGCLLISESLQRWMCVCLYTWLSKSEWVGGGHLYRSCLSINHQRRSSCLKGCWTRTDTVWWMIGRADWSDCCKSTKMFEDGSRVCAVDTDSELAWQHWKTLSALKCLLQANCPVFTSLISGANNEFSSFCTFFLRSKADSWWGGVGFF